MNRLLMGVATLFALSACGPGDPCLSTGTATVTVQLDSGLAGSRAHVTLTGPGGVTREASTTMASDMVTLTAVPAGKWTVAADPIATPDPLIRFVHQGTADPATFCVANAGTQAVHVTWADDPAGHTLWALNGSGGSGALLGFKAGDLGASGTVTASAKGTGPYGHDVTFDRAGNLWSLGGTTADATIVRTAGRLIPSTEAKTADVKVQIEGLSCLPAATGLAFDKSGNLWVSSACKHQVMKIDASELLTSGTVTPSVVLSGLMAPAGLAFDKDGNLFVADGDLQRVVRYDVSALGASAAMPSAKLLVRASDLPLDMTPLAPSWLAFDADGNLWADDFGANVVFRVAKADLSGSGEKTVTPPVRITLEVGALLEGLAFDEGGGLWVAYKQGKIARLDRSQLSTSSGAGAPTVPMTIVSSSDIGNASNLALWPAPAALPLFHALP